MVRLIRLFTDKNHLIKKRRSENSTIETIMSKFCGSPESIIEKADEIVAICITNNDFLLLPPRQLQGILAE